MIEICNVGPDGVWYDDDGIIRCEECHANVATAWGGDYDVLVSRRNNK